MAKERIPLHLPTKKEHENGLNTSPLDAILNGALDLGLVSLDQARHVREEAQEYYADLFTSEEMRRESGLVLRTMAHYARQEIQENFGIPIHIKSQDAIRRDEDSRMKELLAEGKGKVNRIVLMEKKKALLAVGYEFSDNHKIRLKVYDPRHPKQLEVMRNRDANEAARAGYVVISTASVEQDTSPQVVVPLVEIFPGEESTNTQRG